MAAYEILLMLDPELPEERQSEVVGRTRELVERGGGTWVSQDIWGRRKLAYEIDHKGEGVYHLLTFDSSRARSAGFVRKPVSTRIAGTFAQLKPVRSLRGMRPRSAAPVARTTLRWTRRAARKLRA